jgi:hypothetical protein
MNTPEPSLPAKPDPAIWDLPEMRAAVASRDIGWIYSILRRHGLSQPEIAVLTRQSQPEVAAIMAGCRVLAYDVLFRIARGLGFPLCLAGLASCCAQCPGGNQARCH